MPNKLIDSQNYKRLRRKTLIAFHSFSHYTYTTTQLNLSFLKTLNDSKTTQRLVLSFRNLHQFHSNVTKTLATFWSEVHFKPMTNLELSNALAHDAKLVLSFITLGSCWDPRDLIKITDHFACTSANVITYTYCQKLYIGETGRRLGDRFREHLRDVERNVKDASKSVARHFHLLSHSKQHIAVCGLSLHLGSSESRKTLQQKFIFQIGTLNPYGINERFSFN